MDGGLVMGAIDFPFRLTHSGAVGFIADDPVREVTNELINALTTLVGERVMRPGYGGNVHTLLFQNGDDALVQERQAALPRILTDMVPRSIVRTVDIATDPVEGVIGVRVQFEVADYVQSPVFTATINLESHDVAETS